MRYRKNYEFITGFNLPTNLRPKPNKVVYTRPKLVNGILTSKAKKRKLT